MSSGMDWGERQPSPAPALELERGLISHEGACGVKLNRVTCKRASVERAYMTV
jgi:hypothetical protein